MTEHLDALILATDNEGLSGSDLLLLQQRIAAERYRFSEVVSQLSRKAMQAEVDRKSVFAKAKLTAKAQASAKMGEATAADEAEQRPEVIRARSEEIEAQAEYEAMKMKMNASGEVLSSLSMRIANMRDAAKDAKFHQHA